MIRIDYRRKNIVSGLLLSAMLVLLFSACTHLRHLDRAQDAFNTGATLENNNFFNPVSISANSPETYYSIAFAEASKAMGTKILQNKLENVKVLGTTHAIKALAAWKLKRYKIARDEADNAMTAIEKESQSVVTNINGMRDYVLMKALNYLIDIQESNDALMVALAKNKTVTDDEAVAAYKKWVANEGKTGTLENAISKLEEIAASLEDDHELRTYFIMSQLAAYKTRVFALNNVKYHFDMPSNTPDANEKAWWKKEFNGYKKDKDKALAALAAKIPEAQKDVLNSWYILLGPPNTSNEDGDEDIDID